MITYRYGNIGLTYTCPSDRDQFFHWRNNYDIWKWCRQNGPITYSQHSSYWHLVDGCNDKKFFAIVAADGTLGATPTTFKTVGCAGLTSIDNVNSSAEFSLYIGPEYHRKGYGKTALKTLIEYGFNYLNLNSIWGETFDGNPALKMFLDIGMKQDGTRRGAYYRNGRYINCHLISALRQEWKFSKSSLA